MGLVRRSLVIATGAGSLLISVAWAQVDDHLKCYKIKDPIRLSGVLDLDTPQFGPESGCTVSRAKLFCVPATKTVVSAENKATGSPITPLPVSAAPTAEDRVCYKVRCPLGGDVPDQVVTDQFGSRTLSRFKVSMVCTPAVKGATYCGNGTVNPGEDCEVGNLNGATCQTLGFETGVLACGAGCTYDRSDCACTGVTCSFPASGQTIAYTANTQGFPPTPLAVPDDGTLEAGATLAYTDNGDGTITDLNTGLMWEKKGYAPNLHNWEFSYNWSSEMEETIWDWLDDVNAEGGTGFAGYDDWRIPNVRELQSIIDYGRQSPAVDPVFHTGCLSGCSELTCSCTDSFFYWTSSTYTVDPAAAWNVYFGQGTVDAVSFGFTKLGNMRVRAVRGGS